MTTITLHLSSGQTMQQDTDQSLVEARDALAQTIGTQGSVNVNAPGRVRVVNSAHIVYAEVTT